MAAKETVCVTGANGFIGSWLIKTLIEKGYTKIHASIYPGSDPTHILNLPGSDPNSHAQIKVFEADVLDGDAVARAIDGCAGIFHVASPCTLDQLEDPEKELIEPAVKGTINVLKAAKRFRVRRVVITSSVSTLVPNPNRSEDCPVDESCWADVDYCKSIKRWYGVSKTLAEQAGWKFAKENGVDMVTILPSMCLGPLLQPSLNASCRALLQLLVGTTDEHKYWLGAVHVRDVAKAQILLLETKEASGRFICTNGSYQFSDFTHRMSQLFPEFPIHRFGREREEGITPPLKEASKKIMKLGMTFTPLEDAIKDTVESRNKSLSNSEYYSSRISNY